MKKLNGNRYKPREFAKKAGVTIRTLHYYDRIGLLKPSAHTGAGFRLYRDGDFARLQQIVTLKFIGFSLREIKRLLDRKGPGLTAALRAQRMTLEQKRRHLDSAIAAIAKAESIAVSEFNPGWEAFQKITEEIQMQTNTGWTKQYYNEEASKLIGERKKLWSPELQKEIEEKWAELFKDIEVAAADNMDPAGPPAQALAERQAKLIEGFTAGHAAIEEGLTKMWKDQANWPETMKKQLFEPFAKRGVAAAQSPTPNLLTPKADEFMKRAVEARNRVK